MESLVLGQATNLRRIQNAKGWATTFTSRWITPGLVNYKDTGAGVGYVSKEAIDRSMHSMVGRPLVIKHEPIDKETGKKVDPVTPSNMDGVAGGYISRVWWGDDGWAWLEGTCHDDEAKELARPKDRGGKGWRVSCCYVSSDHGPAGKLNGIPYDFEVRAFTGEHLALHPNPRYEGARIFMNGKPTAKMNNPIRLLVKALTAAAPAAAAASAAAPAAAPAAGATPTEDNRLANGSPDGEAIEIGRDFPVEIGAGNIVLLGDLIDSHARIANGMDLDPEQEVEYCAGKRAKVGAIFSHYANAMEDEEKKAKEDEDRKKNGKGTSLTTTISDRIAAATTTGTSGLSFTSKNGSDVQGKPGHFLRLVHAADTAGERQILKNAGREPETQAQRIKRGQERWGKPSKMALQAKA